MLTDFHRHFPEHTLGNPDYIWGRLFRITWKYKRRMRKSLLYVVRKIFSLEVKTEFLE